MDVENIEIVCQNNQKIFVNKKFKQFAQTWAQIYDDTDDENIIDYKADPDLIILIDLFYQMHDYDKNNILIIGKITNYNIQEQIDKISYQYLIGLGYINQKITQIQHKQIVTQWVEKINKLQQECYRLNCQELIEIINISIAIYFYIENPNEKEFKKFSEIWGIQYPIAPSHQRQIVENNKILFERHQINKN